MVCACLDSSEMSNIHLLEKKKIVEIVLNNNNMKLKVTSVEQIYKLVRGRDFVKISN